MANTSYWASEVLPEILWIITSKLSFVDIRNVALVCKNWFAACKVYAIRVPWKMQPFYALGESMSYAHSEITLSTVRNDTACEATFPALLNKRICGTFPVGWVMTVGQGSDIELINLLHNTSVQLPSLTRFPGVLQMRPTPHGTDHFFVYTFRTFAFPPEIDLPSDIMQDKYISKVAISSSPDSNGCIIMAIHGLENMLSYFRIGSNMRTWNLANPGGRLHRYHDIMYHKGELCEKGGFLAVRVQGMIVSVVTIVGLERDKPTVKIMRFKTFDIKSEYFHLYVLELSGQPLIACRLVDADINGRTIGFQLFLVRLAGFIELLSLESSSIFVGSNNSFSVSCIDYPRSQRNRIFFTQSFLQTDRRHRRVGFRCSDVGVFHLAGGIVHRDERASLCDGPPPVWITPFANPSSSSFRFGPRAATGKQKVNVKFVVFGHASCGKSTIVGNLLYQLHHVDSRLYENDGGELNYAWVLDKLKAERERGSSIDNALCEFETRKYCCALTVSPGRRDFIRNMITGASQADCAILVVDSTEGFEIGMSEYGETREHLLLAYALGVKQIICCCNKMDATSPNYSSGRYFDIVKVVSTYLQKIGYSTGMIQFVPVSGMYGKNIVKWSSKMDWYDGPTLFEAINQIKEPKHPSDIPLCPLPREVYYIRGCQASVGHDSGHIHTGTVGTFTRSGVSEEMAVVSQNLKHDGVASRSKHEPAQEAATFTAKVFVVGYCVKIGIGFTGVISNQSYHNTVKVEAVVTGIDKSGKDLPMNPKFLGDGDVGIVKIRNVNMPVTEGFHKFPPLGRFLLRSMNQVVAVGVIQNIEKVEKFV